jgi:hypothetical protein
MANSIDTENLRTLIYVAFNDSTNTYNVVLGRGSSVPETAFGVAVIVKSLIKNNIIDKPEQFIDLVNKYLHDPQYEEVTDKDTETAKDNEEN